MFELFFSKKMGGLFPEGRTGAPGWSGGRLHIEDDKLEFLGLIGVNVQTERTNHDPGV
jgi:hypothetical protein